ncbi:MAG: hypothetical protein RI924_502 [Bacteroidota bacterium]
MSATPKNYQSILEAVSDLEGRGYDYNYQYKEGMLHCDRSKSTYCPADLLITEVYRFEGMSDPTDNSVVYAIESKDGSKGVLVDAYGTYSDDAKSRFLEQIPVKDASTE